jgi:hypothetical protein
MKGHPHAAIANCPDHHCPGPASGRLRLLGVHGMNGVTVISIGDRFRYCESALRWGAADGQREIRASSSHAPKDWRMPAGSKNSSAFGRLTPSSRPYSSAHTGSRRASFARLACRAYVSDRFRYASEFENDKNARGHRGGKSLILGEKMVLPVRIELTTSALPRMRSTTELRQHRVRSEADRAGPMSGAPTIVNPARDDLRTTPWKLPTTARSAWPRRCAPIFAAARRRRAGRGRRATSRRPSRPASEAQRRWAAVCSRTALNSDPARHCGQAVPFARSKPIRRTSSTSAAAPRRSQSADQASQVW